MQTSLEQAIDIIKTLPTEDYDKIRKILDEIENNSNEKMNHNRALEVLRKFHDDFYNEKKDGFSQEELRTAVNWVLTKWN